MYLYDYVFLVVVFPELRRRTALAFLEDTIEVRDVIETAMIAYLYNSHSTIGKQS